MKPSHGVAVLAIVAGIVGALSVGVGSSHAARLWAKAEPLRSAAIEGIWYPKVGAGAIEITATGPGTFVGEVTKPLTLAGSKCFHPVGETPLALSGSGDTYTGTLLEAGDANCKTRISHPATFPYPWYWAKGELQVCIRNGAECWNFTREERADTSGPKVRALGGTWDKKRRKLELSYQVSDESGQARVQVSVVNEYGNSFWKRDFPLGPVTWSEYVNVYMGLGSRRPSRWKLCVQAWDPAGNASRRDCKAITI